MGGKVAEGGGAGDMITVSCWAVAGDVSIFLVVVPQSSEIVWYGCVGAGVRYRACPCVASA